MQAVLGLILVSVIIVECGIPFVYNQESASDPKKVGLLREALMHAGVSPDGIIVKSVIAKWEVYRTAYKATYINQKGQTCYLKWHVNDIVGTQTPKMPICENVATGTGSDGMEGRYVGPPVVGPAAVGLPGIVGPPAVVLPPAIVGPPAVVLPPAIVGPPAIEGYGPPYGPPYAPPYGPPYGPPYQRPYGPPYRPPYGPPQGPTYRPPYRPPYGPPQGPTYRPSHGPPYEPPPGPLDESPDGPPAIGIPGIIFGPPGIVDYLPPGYACPPQYTCPGGVVGVGSATIVEVENHEKRKKKNRGSVDIKVRATTTRPDCIEFTCLPPIPTTFCYPCRNAGKNG